MSPSISRIPFPSILHVLEADPHQPMLPRRPSVITVVDLNQADSKSPPTWNSSSPPHNVSSSHRDLMQTIDLRDVEPIAKGYDEQFSFLVQFPDEDGLEDSEDGQTAFEEKRPTTSRGFKNFDQSTAKTIQTRNFSVLVVTAVRKLLPVKMTRTLRRNVVQH